MIAGTTAGDTLFTLRRPGRAAGEGDEVFLASEPFDEGRGWREVPEESVVVATREHTDVRPIG